MIWQLAHKCVIFLEEISVIKMITDPDSYMMFHRDTPTLQCILMDIWMEKALDKSGIDWWYEVMQG